MTSLDLTPQIGRPREFDRDEVLTALVELFWEQGFGATSIGDVVARTGLSKSSLYGAFGSKEGLYQAALDRYLNDHQAMVRTMLIDGEDGLADVDRFFDRLWEQIDQMGEDRGCLLVNTSTELAAAEPSLVAMGDQHRQVMRDGFSAALGRAADNGELPRDRVTALAHLMVTTALGLAVMIRGGAQKPEIRAHLDAAKAAIRAG